jgi:hypothetical protein
MKLLVCGGRSFTDARLVAEVLDEIHASTPVTELCEGGASGADKLAFWWGVRRYVWTSTVPADFSRLGPSAGPIRNAQMLAKFRPDLVVAFPGGRGTADMVGKAEKAGIPVLRITADQRMPLGLARRGLPAYGEGGDMRG